MGLKLKKTFFKSLILLSVFALLIVSLDWYLASTGYNSYIGWMGLHNLAKPEYIQIVMPACLLLLSIMTLVSLLASKAENQLVTKTEHGDSIKLTPRSVEKCIHRQIMKELPEVLKVTVNADQKYSLFMFATDRLNISVSVSVATDTKISDLNQKIKINAESVLKKIFGLDDKFTTKVTVYDVSANRGPRKSKKAKSASPKSDKKSAQKSLNSGNPKESAVS